MPGSNAILTARDAIARHVQWKITLQFAIAMREPLSADQDRQIREPRRCAIGLWLEADEQVAMKLNPAYGDLFHKHLSFHREMERVANLIAMKRFDDAAEAIEADSSFIRSSKALAMAMTAYDRIAPIAVRIESAG